jgi:hypothetical protein
MSAIGPKRTSLVAPTCPLSGAKQTSRLRCEVSAFDPSGTLDVINNELTRPQPFLLSLPAPREWCAMIIDHQIIAFAGIAALLTIIPGQDTVLVIRNVMAQGQRAGLLTTFGICCGLFVHATLSAVGLSLILLKSATAFEVVKFLGAAYFDLARRPIALARTPWLKPSV